jgi:hypothetical protein
MALAHDFPIIPHMGAGADCCGCIVPEADGDRVTLKCNECGASVGYINRGILEDMVMLVNAAASVKRHVFAAGDAPEVLTSISEECQHEECDRCPGAFHCEDAGDQPVFCVHVCHQIKSRGGVSSFN